MAISIWRISAHRFGLNVDGEIEWQIFFAKLWVLASFHLANKVWGNQSLAGHNTDIWDNLRRW